MKYSVPRAYHNHTAIERPVESVVIALCRSIVFVLIPMFLLTPFIGQKGIWLSMPIAELLTLTVSIPLVLVSLKRLTRTIEILHQGNQLPRLDCDGV